VNTTHETGELSSLAIQGEDHIACLRALLSNQAPPDVAVIKHAVAATRALRGSASLLGLDPFQTFLGRLFQLLEDVESGELPWSGRAESVLREVQAAESLYLESLLTGDSLRGLEAISRVEARLATWRRQPAPEPTEQAPPPPPAAGIPAEIGHTVQQLQRLRRVLESQALPSASRGGSFATLEREMALIQAALRTGTPPAGIEAPQEGLRNHCEGALHHLVEAAAREVLEEARERGLRLGLRVTGALDPVDERLGAALLEVLAHLWSDSLEVQAARGEAQIDTILRRGEHRLVVEIRDTLPVEEAWRLARNDDDVLGCYSGLRRSRPLVESLHGLVQVEPEDLPGCRFRMALPLSTDRPHVSLLRVGRYEIAVASCAVDAVLDTAAVRAAYDVAGAFVEADGMRVPVLHLAFLLGDVAYDELERQHVVVVGSFERRAALYASDARRSVVGRLMPEAHGPWAGTLETEAGVYPMLHVGSLLGRSNTASAVTAPRRGPGRDPAPRDTAAVLVAAGTGLNGEGLQDVLAEAGYAVRTATSADEAWSVLESEPVGLVVCDLRLPEMMAQQLSERRRQNGKHLQVPMVLILAQAGEQSHLVVQQLGATAWVRSPVERETLLDVVRRHIGRT
jgi:CheY-like chemotaxis protein